ncbi:MAG: MBL fold metallo-hydrolase [Candidatus Hydrogenedentota bacterium]|nr:MAG: MBL fold metallo-hydrolase [Candidatus Hydrogenedentota bacterium]
MVFYVYGTRGILPAPYPAMMKYGGNTSCYFLALNNEAVIFDAGTGIRKLGEDLLKQKTFRKIYLFISHAHNDHVSGLPYFLPLYAENFEVNIYGPGEDISSFKREIFHGVHRSTFPIPLRKWNAHVRFFPLQAKESQDPILGNEFECSYFQLNHPVRTLGYRFQCQNKILVYALDHEKYHEPDGTISAEAAHQNQLFLNHIQNADLYIADGQYLPNEYKAYRGWGHATFADCVNFAALANVKKVMITHYDPNRTDEDLDKIYSHYFKVIRRKSIPVDLIPAMEGMSLRLHSKRFSNPYENGEN